MYKFTVKKEHILLLQNAHISWDNCEFGAPAIDCKRPYGNSYVIGDIAEILNIEPEDDGNFSDKQIYTMTELHKETETVLQIGIDTKKFKKGTYIVDEKTRKWKKFTVVKEVV